MKTLLLLAFLMLGRLSAPAQDLHPFQAGESLTYSIYYYLMGVWVGAGEVTFSVHDDQWLGKDCFRFKGFGTTYPRYDWFFKVKDTYESYADKQSLRPYRFSRDVSEGGFYFIENNIYNYKDSAVYSVLKVKEKPIELDTFDLEKNSQDVLSLVYAARDIDFNTKKVGEKIPVNMVIDRETHSLYLRYLGTEVIDKGAVGKVDCFVFTALLVDGTIFKGGEGLKVWVTRDQNKIPVYIESEIKVGEIRSELKTYSGLKYPIGK